MREESEVIAKLRKQAKQLSTITGEKHTHCLHEVAKQNGYKSWEALILTIDNKNEN